MDSKGKVNASRFGPSPTDLPAQPIKIANSLSPPMVPSPTDLPTQPIQIANNLPNRGSYIIIIKNYS